MRDPVFHSLPGLSALGDGTRTALARALPEETPVALVYDGTTQAVMMATPADIADFAHGFSLTEGFITHPRQIEAFETARHDLGIEARIWLSAERAQVFQKRRRQMAGPVGCGLCGIDSLEEAARALPRVSASLPGFDAQELAQAPEALRAHQPLHDRTRAVHAAGFCLPGRGIVLAREDVGRHNALDKLIGAMLRQGIDAQEGAFVLTSRVSVEMVQKAAMAGAPVIVAVSAPTAHAVRLAQGAGITLAGFARGGRFDLYSDPHGFNDGACHVA